VILLRYLDRLLCRYLRIRKFTHVGTGESFEVKGDLAAAHIALRGMGYVAEVRA
jgi:hypothetical protein